MKILLSTITIFLLLPITGKADSDFLIYPYLQNPSDDAISVLWFSKRNESGTIAYWKDKRGKTTLTSVPVKGIPSVSAALSWGSPIKSREIVGYSVEP